MTCRKELRVVQVLAIAAVLIVAAGCGRPEAAENRSEGRVYVVATTSLVADLVAKVGGERVVVDALMGPGVDPHLYKATAADVVRLQRADVIFFSGLMLEGRMGDMFTRMARNRRPVIAVTDSIPRSNLLQPESFQGHYDPHVWFDVSLWVQTIPGVVEGLSGVDPAGKAYYEERGRLVREDLLALHRWALRKAEEVPPERRVLVTSHDAFNYFGRAYGFEVIALQGISTVAEAGLADMASMVDLIRRRQIPAVFVESSVPHAAIERIARDAGVRVGGELFSDALGSPGRIENGNDVGTYEGMVRHNLTVIVDALLRERGKEG